MATNGRSVGAGERDLPLRSLCEQKLLVFVEKINMKAAMQWSFSNLPRLHPSIGAGNEIFLSESAV